MEFRPASQAASGTGAPSSPAVTYESVIPNPNLKLLDQLREVLRLKHYSIRTERTYADWVRRYVKFHALTRREDRLPAEPKMEAFLSDLAVVGNVAVSTQNQAFNALPFLYREVLHVAIRRIDSVRATRPARVPTVLTPQEAGQVLGAMSGTPLLMVKLIYGGGLRLLEALRLRVKDVDFAMKQLTVRDGKGAKDRYTVLPSTHFMPATKLGCGVSRMERSGDAEATQGGGAEGGTGLATAGADDDVAGLDCAAAGDGKPGIPGVFVATATETKTGGQEGGGMRYDNIINPFWKSPKSEPKQSRAKRHGGTQGWRKFQIAGYTSSKSPISLLRVPFRWKWNARLAFIAM